MNALASKLYKRITNFILAFLVATATLTAIGPFLTADSASAAPGIVYNTIGFSSLSYNPDRATPSGGYVVAGDSLTLNIDNENPSPLAAGNSFYKTEGLQATIANSTSITADLTVDAAWEGHPVRAGMWAVAGSETAVDVAWPLIEFTNIGDGAFTGWRVFDTMNGGWTNLTTPAYGTTHTVEITFNAATKQYDYYIGGVLLISLDAFYGSDTYGRFQAVIFNNYNSITTAADNYSVVWSNFRIGQAPTVSECSVTSSLYTSDLSTWDTSRTRANGHNEITEDGLHIYTDTDVTGSPDPRKAAGYYATNFALSGVGNQTIAEAMDYISNGTSAPGLQLIVDLDNDASTDTVDINGKTGDGILVGEAIYNTDEWWLAEGNSIAQTGAPHASGGGYNTDYYGTIDEWLAQFPSARVNAIGYSLGSGANGDGIITRISLGCVDYTFGPEIAPEQPTDGGSGTDSPATPTTPTTTPVSIVTPIITGPASVLGSTDNTDTTGESDIEGVTDDKTATADTGVDGIILGLMWYWWILILAGAAGLTWWIIAAYRRRNNEE